MYFVGYYQWQYGSRDTAEVKFFRNKENAWKFAKTKEGSCIQEIKFEEDKIIK